MTRSWWENEEIIRQFRDWLTQTAEEIDALDQNNGLFGDFESADDAEPFAHRAAARDEPSSRTSASIPDVGLLQLVEAFTALRHELKLQTKGTRNLEASVERSLGGLDAASRVFQSIQADEDGAAERAALPMIEALIGLDEGLLRAERAFQATHREMTQSAPARLREHLDVQFAQQSWWRRWMASRWHAQVCAAAGAALARSIADELANLMQGFQLIQSRLARTLQEFDVRRLDETGGPLDPNRMTVVELVTDINAPPETVIDVVRPGYSWGERVVRFAEVRAVARRAPQYDDVQPPCDGSPPGSGSARHAVSEAAPDAPDDAPSERAPLIQLDEP